MNTVLICGGFLEEETAKRALEKIKPDCIIGIDKGLEFCYRNQIYPQYILGDFDSIDKKVLDFYENQKEIPVQRECHYCVGQFLFCKKTGQLWEIYFFSGNE